MSDDSKSILILGCGYVGGAVAKHALSLGYSVSALTRNSAQASSLKELGLDKVVVAELDSEDWHSDLSGTWDFVLNSVSSAGNGVSGYEKSYLRGNHSVIKWAHKNSISRYLYTSSTSVYSQTCNVVTEESSVENPSERSELLLAAEDLVRENAALFDAWYLFRLSGIYGPGRHYLLNQLRQGVTEVAGSGDYRLNLIHLEDIVTAIFSAFDSDSSSSGVYNISDGNPYKKDELLHFLAKKLGVVCPAFNPDIKTGRMAGFAGSPPDRTISSDKAQKKLGWKAIHTSFHSGYQQIFSAEL